MKKGISFIIILCFLILNACSPKEEVTKNPQSWKESFADLEKQAEGTTVNLFMWGGDENINRYIDKWVAPRLKKEADITLLRKPMDAKQFIEKLSNEKKANRKKGTIDVIWINGDNFKRAKEEELLIGPFAQGLPNIQKYVRKELQQSDTGESIDGLEAPWGNVQFVFQYNEKYIKQPPVDLKGLLEFTKQNPGKFTYPEVKDFTGNAFVRHMLYEENGAAAFSDGNVSDEQLNKAYQYLNEIKPYLWKEGKTYPRSLEQLDRMFANEEVWITMGFNERRAEPFIQNKVFPNTTKSFILQSGSISSTHFLSIPFNSPNPKGAMVVINYLLSPEAQAAKLDTKNWGDGTVLDVSKLDEKIKEQFESSGTGPSTLSPEQFNGKGLPEFNAETIKKIENTWYNKVVGN